MLSMVLKTNNLMHLYHYFNLWTKHKCFKWIKKTKIYKVQYSWKDQTKTVNQMKTKWKNPFNQAQKEGGTMFDIRPIKVLWFLLPPAGSCFSGWKWADGINTPKQYYIAAFITCLGFIQFGWSVDFCSLDCF